MPKRILLSPTLFPLHPANTANMDAKTPLTQRPNGNNKPVKPVKAAKKQKKQKPEPSNIPRPPGQGTSQKALWKMKKQLSKSIRRFARGNEGQTLPKAVLNNPNPYFGDIYRLQGRSKLLSAALKKVSGFYSRCNWKAINDDKKVTSFLNDSNVILNSVVASLDHLSDSIDSYLGFGESDEDVKPEQDTEEGTTAVEPLDEHISDMRGRAKKLARAGNTVYEIISTMEFNSNNKTATFVAHSNVILDTIVADLVRFLARNDEFTGYDKERSKMRWKNRRGNGQGKKHGNAQRGEDMEVEKDEDSEDDESDY
ncbi:hypothetical protein GGR57DRAFT_153403 [Xylariaceae sp. FL1272]|nr:hypothetical protein GGR57DRAFT_153403 [Xylariaceae sp. FL1272]